MLIQYNNYIKRIAYVSGFMFLITCISVQANGSQDLNGTSTSGSQTTFQLSQNSDDQTNRHAKNKADGQSEIDLGAGDYVSAYDTSASALLDIEVIDNNGVEVGVIKDYLIKAGEIEYAVVLVKDVPVLDDTIVKKFVAVPYNELRIDDKSALSRAELQVKLMITQQQINQKPEFKFNSNKDSQQTHDNVAKTAEVNYDISAKEVIDMKVFGNSGNLLGLIKDLIIRNNNSVTYAIITIGVLGLSDKLIAAPFQELQIHKAEEKVILNVTSQALEDAPGFQMRNP